MTIHRLTLILTDHLLAICRLEPETPLPIWATSLSFFAITRTAEELSVVCREDAVPAGIKCERGWRCLRVAGTMPFTLTGVLASLTAPLAVADIGIFAISTFDTDYLLVQEKDLENALQALRRAGHML